MSKRKQYLLWAAIIAIVIALAIFDDVVRHLNVLPATLERGR